MHYLFSQVLPGSTKEVPSEVQQTGPGLLRGQSQTEPKPGSHVNVGLQPVKRKVVNNNNDLVPSNVFKIIRVMLCLVNTETHAFQQFCCDVGAGLSDDPGVGRVSGI